MLRFGELADADANEGDAETTEVFVEGRMLLEESEAGECVDNFGIYLDLDGGGDGDGMLFGLDE